MPIESTSCFISLIDTASFQLLSPFLCFISSFLICCLTQHDIEVLELRFKTVCLTNKHCVLSSYDVRLFSFHCKSLEKQTINILLTSLYCHCLLSLWKLWALRQDSNLGVGVGGFKFPSTKSLCAAIVIMLDCTVHMHMHTCISCSVSSGLRQPTYTVQCCAVSCGRFVLGQYLGDTDSHYNYNRQISAMIFTILFMDFRGTRFIGFSILKMVKKCIVSHHSSWDRNYNLQFLYSPG